MDIMFDENGYPIIIDDNNEEDQYLDTVLASLDDESFMNAVEEMIFLYM